MVVITPKYLHHPSISFDLIVAEIGADKYGQVPIVDVATAEVVVISDSGLGSNLREVHLSVGPVAAADEIDCISMVGDNYVASLVD